MKTINIHQAKTHLSRLLVRVAQGEEVVIAKAGRPVARLVPIAQAEKRRTPNEAAGQIRMADDFDDLPPEILETFYR